MSFSRSALRRSLVLRGQSCGKSTTAAAQGLALAALLDRQGRHGPKPTAAAAVAGVAVVAFEPLQTDPPLAAEDALDPILLYGLGVPASVYRADPGMSIPFAELPKSNFLRG